MKILHLTLMSEWYLAIELGRKNEEYREIKPYWYQRLYQRKSEYLDVAGPLNKEDAEYACDPRRRNILHEGFKDNELKPYTHVLFRRGYTKSTLLRKIDSITIGRGNPELGAPEDRDVFIIKFHEE